MLFLATRKDLYSSYSSLVDEKSSLIRFAENSVKKGIGKA